MNAPSSAELLAPIVGWFSLARRQLPWRAEDLDHLHPDPYAVLVSEVMLQQTQAAKVIPYFQRWMERFPDPPTLARASDDEVHKCWEGLGYYRRARYLKQAAQHLTDSGWPSDLDGLRALPGLGPYSAAAVASIAFQWPEAALDGNAFRVISRVLGMPGDPRPQAQTLRAWLQPALKRFGPSRITQAIMELGATLCSPRPDCGGCPLKGACEARRLDLTDRIPPPRPRRAVTRTTLWLIAILAEDHCLLREPIHGGLLAGLWRWPHLQADELDPSPVQHPSTILAVRTWNGWTQTYTHREEQVLPAAIELSASVPAPRGCAWVPTRAVSALPLGKRDQRLRDLLSVPGEPAGVPAQQLVGRIMNGDQDPPR